MKTYSGHVPFLKFALAMVLGVILSMQMAPSEIMYKGLVGTLVLVIAGLVMSYRSGRLFGVLFCIMCMLFAWLRIWDTHPVIKSTHFSHNHGPYLLVRIHEEPRIDERYVRMQVRVLATLDSHDEGVYPRVSQGRLMVTIERNTDTTERPQWMYGVDLIIPANYHRSSPPKNPGEMDYAAHLAKFECWHQAYLQEDEVRMLSDPTHRLSRREKLKSTAILLRKTMIEKFDRYIPDRNAFAIASTLILGYRADLSRELLETYSATGTIHVLSVSGMHVVIVFWLLARLLFWMNLHLVLMRLRIPFLILAIWTYALITGFSPSVLRAAMMLSFVLWGQYSGRVARTYNSLGASAFFLLLYDPRLLLHIGFQLSYLAVLGIVFFYPILSALLRTRSKWIRPIRDYSVLSIAAQAGAGPLATLYFQQFPMYFLLANLLIVLPASFIMYLGFAVLLIPEMTGWTFLLKVLGKVLCLLIVSVNRLLGWVQSLPAAHVTGLDLNVSECVLLYVALLLLVFSGLRRSKTMMMSFTILMLVFLVSWQWRSWEKSVRPKLVIHQVRSGLAISVTGLGRPVLYTDLSDVNQSGLQFSVLPYLQTFSDPERIRKIGHNDHYVVPGLYFGQGMIQIGERRLYVYDGRNELRLQQTEREPFAVDLLLIRENPRKPMLEILANYPCKQLVVDGSNYPSTIRRIESQLREFPGFEALDYYELKDNFAYVWFMDEDR